jgi:REP element-mobilizing transposase RayT
MARSRPIAYLVTLRTFGTWLHGDARGSHDCLHRTYGTPPLAHRPRLEAVERHRARVPPQLLDARSRTIVERVASDVCDYRCWQLLAVNARTNHVHLVVAADSEPEVVALSLKSWITRKLVEAGALPKNVPLWSRHASTVYLWTVRSRDRAMHYVMHEQDVEPERI